MVQVGDAFPTAPVVHHEGFAGNSPGSVKTWEAVSAGFGKYLVVTLPGAFTPT
jgi:peroxiredoxin